MLEYLDYGQLEVLYPIFDSAIVSLLPKLERTFMVLSSDKGASLDELLVRIIHPRRLSMDQGSCTGKGD